MKTPWNIPHENIRTWRPFFRLPLDSASGTFMGFNSFNPPTKMVHHVLLTINIYEYWP